MGLPAAEERFKAGLHDGTAVINRPYYETIMAGFQAHGAAALADFLATTDPPQVPLHDLARRAP
ncbi:MAG: hypothetical protein HC876_02180 [Chloroflexaceae bacterium]|nr:hypothetical protein [Chloroflexaceae bacterium]